MTPNKLISVFHEIQTKKYIMKKTQTEIENWFIKYDKKFNNNEKKIINELISILKQGKINTESKNKILNLSNVLIEKIIHNKKLFNYLDTNDDTNNKFGEELLDSQVPKYNKLNQNNPMCNVTLNGDNWRFRSNKNNIDKKNNDRNKIIKFAVNFFINKWEITHNVINDTKVSKDIIHSDNLTLITYNYDNIKYYDIQHILSYITNNETYRNDKYTFYKKKIKIIISTKNIYGGYIFRELISINTVKKMIVSSNTTKSINLSKLLNIKINDIQYLSKEQSTLSKILTVFDKEETVCQKTIGKYKIDLYFTKYNLAIECDEFNHNDRNKEYEKKRQKFIENELNATFIRYNPDCINFDIFKVISQIHYHIINF